MELCGAKKRICGPTKDQMRAKSIFFTKTYFTYTFGTISAKNSEKIQKYNQKLFHSVKCYHLITKRTCK